MTDHHELTSVRITRVEGGLYLTQIIAGAEGIDQIFVPDVEIAALAAALQRRLTAHLPDIDMAVGATSIWRVSGTLLYDDADGEEHAIDVAVSVEAADRHEALRITLEELQERYVGATWEATPEIEPQM